MRLTKEEYFLGIAEAVSKRSTCIRARGGAILVKNDKIISTGYIGAPRGDPNCCDIGICKREKLNILPGQNYELCRSVHAEQNCIINCNEDKSNTIMYLYFERLDGKEYKHNGPCEICKRYIKNVNILKVITREI